MFIKALLQRITLTTKLLMKLDHFDRFVLIIAALIICYQLCLPPIVGVFDNGDYWKIMSRAGFRHLSETPEDMHVYLNRKYLIEKPFWSNSYYISSETLIARAAHLIGRILSKDGLFDIRVLGLIHTLLFLLGVALIISATHNLQKISRWVISLLLVFFFTDVSYIAFFNSFYSQTASLLFLIITAGLIGLFISDRGETPIYYFGFITAAILFICSKPQESAQAVPLATLAFLSGRYLKIRFAKIVGTAMMAVVLLAGGWYYLKTPALIRDPCLYNAVFDELLRYSPNPSADLKKLGLDDALIKYANTHAFIKGAPVNQVWFRSKFYDKVGYHDLLVFYFMDPHRFWMLVKRKATYAFTLVTGYANFEKSAGFPPGKTSSAFKVWSDLKKKVFPGSPWTLLILIGGNLTAVAILLRRAPSLSGESLFFEVFGILNLMALVAFLTVTLGDSNLDPARHLYSFNAMTDLIILGDGLWLLEASVRQVRRFTGFAS